MFSRSDLTLCQRRGGILERINRATGRTEYKMVKFNCGKSTCPVCQDKRKNRLIHRLRLVKWNSTVYFWTITTDPKVLDVEEALKTINRRWHIVHRSIIRATPRFRYFRVIEFTKSGLPHIHFITDSYINWHELQRHLKRLKFGEVLHFKKIPLNIAINYLCKYIAKGVYETDHPHEFNGRFWATSVRLLPLLSYGDNQGEWHIVWVERDLDHLADLLHAYKLHAERAPPA